MKVLIRVVIVSHPQALNHLFRLLAELWFEAAMGRLRKLLGLVIFELVALGLGELRVNLWVVWNVVSLVLDLLMLWSGSRNRPPSLCCIARLDRSRDFVIDLWLKRALLFDFLLLNSFELPNLEALDATVGQVI